MIHQLIKKIPPEESGGIFLTLKTINMKFAEYIKYVE